MPPYVLLTAAQHAAQRYNRVKEAGEALLAQMAEVREMNWDLGDENYRVRRENEILDAENNRLREENETPAGYVFAFIQFFASLSSWKSSLRMVYRTGHGCPMPRL